MPNLIDQMEVLKGLTDDVLKTELSQPSGTVPPFLVASEIGRRNDMRKRYEAEAARQKPQTTVADDLLQQQSAAGMVQQMQQPGGGGGGLAAAGGQPLPVGGASGGAPAAVPGSTTGGGGVTMATPGRVPGYASGGIVDALGAGATAGALGAGAVDYGTGGSGSSSSYDDLVKLYNDQLAAVDAENERSKYLALIAAGAAMASGKSSTLGNIAAGLGAGGQSYGSSLSAQNGEKMTALSGLTNVEQAATQRDLAQQNLAQNKEQLQQQADEAQAGRDNALKLQQLQNSGQTADEKNFEYRKTLPPDQQAAFDTTSHPYAVNPNAVTNDDRHALAINDIYQANVKQVFGGAIDPSLEGPDAELEARKKAALLTYQQAKGMYGAQEAAQWAIGTGILTQGDLVTADAPTNGVLTPGAPGAPAPAGGPVPYTQYFGQ